MAYLRYPARSAEHFQQELTVPLVIGRSPDCDLCLVDQAMSRRHCRIEPHENRWRLIDLESRNGTYINGQRIHDQYLNDGDKIRVGDCTLIFSLSAPTGTRPATPRDALLLARVDNELSSSTISGARILPTPRPRKTGNPAGPSSSPSTGESTPAPSLVFNRPPAQPKVRQENKPADPGA